MGSEGKKDELRPWLEEEKVHKPKSIPRKTNMTAKVHSKPKTKGQEYLDMYLTIKEKDRIKQYGEVISDKHEQVIEDWKEVKSEIKKQSGKLPDFSKTEDKENTEYRKKLKKRKMPKNLKKMDWNY